MAYVIAKHTPVGADGKLDKAQAMWSVVDGTRTAFSANRQSAAIAFKNDMDAVTDCILASGFAGVSEISGGLRLHLEPVKAPEPAK